MQTLYVYIKFISIKRNNKKINCHQLIPLCLHFRRSNDAAVTVTTQALKVLDDITKDKGDAIKQLLQVKSCCVTVVSRKLHEKFSYESLIESAAALHYYLIFSVILTIYLLFIGILRENRKFSWNFSYRDFFDNLALRVCEWCKIIKKVEKRSRRGKKNSLKISCSVLISQ